MIEKYAEMVLEFLPRVLLAGVALWAGFKLSAFLTSQMKRALSRKGIDPTLTPFLVSLTSALIKVAVVISVASMIGIETTSFVAVLGAAGLAIGLALQGSLSNFAGGVLILIFRPFEVGDFIESLGHAGTVKEIQIFSTIITTPDNRRIILPNGPLAGGSIVNFSAEENRRVDMSFGVGYSDDVQKAKGILIGLLEKDPRVLKDPASQVVVGELADSSVNFTVRAWTKAADYWDVYFDMQERVKAQFDQNGISIPFPQQEVHVVSAEGLEGSIGLTQSSPKSAERAQLNN